MNFENKPGEKLDMLNAINPQFAEFSATVNVRINDIGAELGRSYRDAQSVSETIFGMVDGDVSKVTDDMIREEFGKL